MTEGDVPSSYFMNCWIVNVPLHQFDLRLGEHFVKKNVLLLFSSKVSYPAIHTNYIIPQSTTL